MKEIWMEKLIELLNEFETPQSWVVFKSYDDYDGTFYWVDIDGETEIAWSDSMILSKRFQWVKWLVENDKIDWKRFYEKNILKWFITITKEEKADSIIMNLSISDTPIDLLCSILK